MWQQEPAIQKKIMECSNRPSQKEEMDHKIKEAAKDEQMLEDKERQSQVGVLVESLDF